MYDMTMFFGHAYIALKLTRWRVSRNQRPESFTVHRESDSDVHVI